jgi:hypothetical protein
LVRLLVNVPDPEPSEVFVPVIVGFWLVLQQTPLAVTGAPPSEEIVPPLVAVVWVMFVAVVVTTIGMLII